MRRSRALVPLILSAVLLAGCSASQSGGGVESSADVAAPAPAPDRGMGDSAGEMPAEGGPGSGDADAGTSSDRQVITTGEVTMTVEDARRAAQEASEIVERAGGRVDARSERAATQYETAQAWLTVRIPADRLTATLGELERLGTVEEISLQESDVTAEVRDLDARIDAHEVSIDRLTALMAEADSTEDLLAAERMLTERQAELERLQAQRRSVGEQVALSTIRISFWEVDDEQSPIPPEQPRSFLDGLSTGWESLLTTLSGLLVALGVLLPWLVFLAVVGAVVVLGVRGRRRRATSRGDAPEDQT